MIGAVKTGWMKNIPGLFRRNFVILPAFSCGLIGILPSDGLAAQPSEPVSESERAESDQWLPGMHPALSPSRDAEVVYHFHVKGKSAPHEVKVFFSGNGDKLRIEQLDSVGITILDRPGQKVFYLNKERHFYLGMRPLHGLRSPFFLDLEMQYRPGPMRKIANVICREWNITAKNGQAHACVTEDGIILQQEGVDAEGVSGKLEALSVSYRKLPPSCFEIPADYHNMRSPPPDIPGVENSQENKTSR